MASAPPRKSQPPVPTPEAARRAAQHRWGAPRKVRLDALTPDQAWLVYNLVQSMLADKAVAS